jgi:hypothetical protein
MTQVSRQRNWQIKKEKAGLCPSCALPKLFKSDRCFRHYVLRALRKAGMLLTEHSDERYYKRRDKMIAEMRGRYLSVALGGEIGEPIDHYTPNKWLRQAPAKDKVAALTARLDRRALREYDSKSSAGHSAG